MRTFRRIVSSEGGESRRRRRVVDGAEEDKEMGNSKKTEKMMRKGRSREGQGGAELDGEVKIENGKKRKKQMRMVDDGGRQAHILETKSKLTRTRKGEAEQDDTSTVKSMSKRKRGDGAEKDDTAKLKRKLKRKRGDGVEQDDTVKTKLKRKKGHGAEQGDAAKFKSNTKRKRKSKTRVEDTPDHPVSVTSNEGDIDEQDEVAKPSIHSVVAVKYVPPHLREVAKGSEERIRLERRIRGLLNRLTEANVESITSDISTIFQANGRHLVSEIISNEIVGACCEGPRGNDQYAAVFAAFVAGMSAYSGIDFGANFVAALATSLEDQYQKGDSLAVRNLALLLSHLYTFHLLPNEVVYEVLTVLCLRFEELDVATILIILQTCGMVLRGDDPSAMKDFVLSIQQRTAEAKAALFNNTENSSGELSKRVQFMLETICDIKNNRRITKEPASHVQLKKWLQKLRVDDVQLRAVTWKGLLDPAKKGQWWLPSAVDTDHRINVRGEMAGAIDGGTVEADRMLQLAASQRMNTDSRRAVFCMVMSGDDYIDAFEKLLRIKLPGTQDREVLRVIMECCLQEKSFNKYYALLAAKLCDHDKNHKFTLQYCLWDHFKQLDKMELRRSANLARFLAHLIGSYSVSLAVLKAVEFTDPQVMTSKVVMHFRIFLDTLLTEYSEEVIWNCFSRVASPPNLAALRDGLALFLHQQIRSAGGGHEGKEVRGFLLSRYRLANKALGNVSGVPLQ